MTVSRPPDPEVGDEHDPGWRRALRTGAIIIAICGWGIVVAHAVSVVLLLLTGSSLLGEWSRDEVARVTSPSGRIDAILYEMNGGATTSFGYEVWVVNLGASVSRSQAERHPLPAYLYGAGRSSRAYGVNLRWEGPSMLVVEYLEARDVTQDVSEVRVGDQTVRVVLRPGVDDPSAPPGGMLYNRGLAGRAGRRSWASTERRGRRGRGRIRASGERRQGGTGRPLGDRPV